MAGRESVTDTFGLIASTTVRYRIEPVPSRVNAIAAPPAVSATWKVFTVALITKYGVNVAIPVVLTMVANETSVPFSSR